MILISSIECVSSMADSENNGDVENWQLLFVAILLGFVAIAKLFSMTIEIIPLNLSVPLLPIAVFMLTPLAIAAVYLHARSDIIWERTWFRYQHPHTGFKGLIYLIPGVTKPYSDILEKLKKEK